MSNADPKAPLVSALDKVARRCSEVVNWSAVALSIWYVGVYLYIAFSRSGYPYDLEWLEGGILEHVAVVRDGVQIYGRPSLTFTPYVYMPVYYWCCAAITWIFGLHLPALRGVSIGASLGTFAFLFLIVRARSQSSRAGVTAVGMFAASYAICGAWLDLARVDSLALFWLMLGTWLLVRGERHDWLAGVALGLAFLTKQSMLPPAMCVIASRVVFLRRFQRVHALLAFAVLTGGISLVENYLSSGWFAFYVFELPAQHPLVESQLWSFWPRDIFGVYPAALLCVGLVLARRKDLREQALFLGFLVGAVVASWMGMMHFGGYTNVLLPSALAFAWATGEAVGSYSSEAAKYRALIAGTLAITQLAVRFYWPNGHIPTVDDKLAADRAVAELQKRAGDALVPFSPTLARRAGKAPCAHGYALFDVVQGSNAAAREEVLTSIRFELAVGSYEIIVIDHPWWDGDIKMHYEPAPRSVADKFFALPAQRTGGVIRAREVWVRK